MLPTGMQDPVVGDLVLDVQQKQAELQAAINALSRRVGSNTLATQRLPNELTDQDGHQHAGSATAVETHDNVAATPEPGQSPAPPSSSDRHGGMTSRIILT